MKSVRFGFTALASLAILATGLQSPAAAADWDVYARAYSFNGGGGESRANLDWRSARKVIYNSFRVNDKCNSSGAGDGLEVRGRAHVVFMNGTLGYGEWHLDHTPDCQSPTGWNGNGLPFESTKAIRKAGVQICVIVPGSGMDNDICDISHADNPLTD